MNYRQNKSTYQLPYGFTLIEIMVSISIFTIIMVTGVGALLSITRSYQVAKEESATLNAVHFALDSMVRDIRIGSSYYADEYAPLEGYTDEYQYGDDESYELTFRGINERGVIYYKFDPSSEGSYLTRTQYVDGETNTASMLTDFEGIELENALFRVVGSDPNDTIQPSVFIYLRGVDEESGSDFVLQTLVSQRNPDF